MGIKDKEEELTTVLKEIEAADDEGWLYALWRRKKRIEKEIKEVKKSGNR